MSSRAVRLHRVLRAKPEKVYRAFLEADALAKWLPPYGFTCTVHHLEANVGGSFKMSFRNFTTGDSHSFGGEYLELVPNQRVRYTDKFDDPEPARRDAGDRQPRAGALRDGAVASSRKASPRRSRSRCATSAGRSR